MYFYTIIDFIVWLGVAKFTTSLSHSHRWAVFFISPLELFVFYSNYSRLLLYRCYCSAILWEIKAFITFEISTETFHSIIKNLVHFISLPSFVTTGRQRVTTTTDIHYSLAGPQRAMKSPFVTQTLRGNGLTVSKGVWFNDITLQWTVILVYINTAVPNPTDILSVYCLSRLVVLPRLATHITACITSKRPSYAGYQCVIIIHLPSHRRAAHNAVRVVASRITLSPSSRRRGRPVR